jgi:hypothetical protein
MAHLLALFILQGRERALRRELLPFVPDRVPTKERLHSRCEHSLHTIRCIRPNRVLPRGGMRHLCSQGGGLITFAICDVERTEASAYLFLWLVIYA